MDKDVEKFCRVTSGYEPPQLMSCVFPPSAPWQDRAADLLGALPTAESFIVLIDYYSRFLEVAFMKSTTSAEHNTLSTTMYPMATETKWYRCTGRFCGTGG